MFVRLKLWTVVAWQYCWSENRTMEKNIKVTWLDTAFETGECVLPERFSAAFPLSPMKNVLGSRSSVPAVLVLTWIAKVSEPNSAHLFSSSYGTFFASHILCGLLSHRRKQRLSHRQNFLPPMSHPQERMGWISKKIIFQKQIIKTTIIFYSFSHA